jgi:hypothetical protein
MPSLGSKRFCYELLCYKPIYHDMGLEHLQEFAKIYLANPMFCQLLKSYAK